MKHLKYFESINPFIRQNNKYEAGDYILVNSESLEIDNKVMKIIRWNGAFYQSHMVENTENWKKGKIISISDSEIVRKLDDYEVDALKYNL